MARSVLVMADWSESARTPCKARTRSDAKRKQTYPILTCCRFARRSKIHRSCVKLHQRVAPSSFVLLHASVQVRNVLCCLAVAFCGQLIVLFYAFAVFVFLSKSGLGIGVASLRRLSIAL